MRSGNGSIDKVILHGWNTSCDRITLRNRYNKIDKIFTIWAMRYFFKSLQYIGPVAMGIGTFILIIACVITFESRDKSKQVTVSLLYILLNLEIEAKVHNRNLYVENVMSFSLSKKFK